jgi:diguanylate cyclase (GGDEF)-like protein
VDRVTGLPAQAQAERVLSQAIEEGRSFHTVVIVIDRLERINARFGRSVGDEVLYAYAQDLQDRLPAGYALYRWSGPSMVLVVSGDVLASGINEELKTLLAGRREHVVESASRTLHLPVSARWLVVPPTLAVRLLIHNIDQFVAAPPPSD